MGLPPVRLACPPFCRRHFEMRTSRSPSSLWKSDSRAEALWKRASQTAASDMGSVTSSSTERNGAGGANGSWGPLPDGSSTCTSSPSSCTEVAAQALHQRQAGAGRATRAGWRRRVQARLARGRHAGTLGPARELWVLRPGRGHRPPHLISCGLGGSGLAVPPRAQPAQHPEQRRGGWYRQPEMLEHGWTRGRPGSGGERPG